MRSCWAGCGWPTRQQGEERHGAWEQCGGRCFSDPGAAARAGTACVLVGCYRHRPERRPRSRRQARREDRIDPVEHQCEVDDRPVTEGVGRERPGRLGGPAPLENGRDVRRPVPLVESSDQEGSRYGGRRPSRAGVVTAALHGDEPSDPGGVGAAEPIRGASSPASARRTGWGCS
jgi:hypothetical protein